MRRLHWALESDHACLVLLQCLFLELHCGLPRVEGGLGLPLVAQLDRAFLFAQIIVLGAALTGARFRNVDAVRGYYHERCLRLATVGGLPLDS